MTDDVFESWICFSTTKRVSHFGDACLDSIICASPENLIYLLLKFVGVYGLGKLLSDFAFRVLSLLPSVMSVKVSCGMLLAFSMSRKLIL